MAYKKSKLSTLKPLPLSLPPRVCLLQICLVHARADCMCFFCALLHSFWFCFSLLCCSTQLCMLYFNDLCFYIDLSSVNNTLVYLMSYLHGLVFCVFLLFLYMLCMIWKFTLCSFLSHMFHICGYLPLCIVIIIILFYFSLSLSLLLSQILVLFNFRV